MQQENIFLRNIFNLLTDTDCVVMVILRRFVLWSDDEEIFTKPFSGTSSLSFIEFSPGDENNLSDSQSRI